MLKKDKGIALVSVYFTVVILMILAAAFFMQAYSESKQSQRHKISTKALCLAEAGVERALYDLRQDFINDTTPSWQDGDINGIIIGPDTDTFYTLYQSTALADGAYEVWLKNVAGATDIIWIRSTGTVDGISRTIHVQVQMLRISVWDNVIFAGSGQAGVLINGNVDIRGSVHILGTNLNIDDLAMDMAIELGGNANIGNNYEGMPAELRNKVPPLDTELFNGEMVETLNTMVRVKQGIVGLSGSATIGDPDASGNAYKETVDGVYVNDGFGGNKGIENVYSDNGANNLYDLGGSVTFPSLSAPFGNYATYMDYLRNNALVISDPAQLNIISNITPISQFEFTDGTNRISMDGTGNLSISGIIYVDGGDLNINQQDRNNTIAYSGSGSIVVTGNVAIDANLITQGNNSFPDNIIGIMTPNNITLGTTSQLDVMGLFYAQNSITSNKQTDVVGTFVSNYFNMGNQVPSIYQVPEAVNHLPPGLIGTAPFYTIKTIVWKEE